MVVPTELKACARFSRLEAVLAQLNEQANYLAGQIQKLGFESNKS